MGNENTKHISSLFTRFTRQVIKARHICMNM